MTISEQYTKHLTTLHAHLIDVSKLTNTTEVSTTMISTIIGKAKLTADTTHTPPHTKAIELFNYMLTSLDKQCKDMAHATHSTGVSVVVLNIIFDLMKRNIEQAHTPQ